MHVQMYLFIKIIFSIAGSQIVLVAEPFCYEKCISTKENEDIRLSRPIYPYLNVLIHYDNYFHYAEPISGSGPPLFF